MSSNEIAQLHLEAQVLRDELAYLKTQRIEIETKLTSKLSSEETAFLNHRLLLKEQQITAARNEVAAKEQQIAAKEQQLAEDKRSQNVAAEFNLMNRRGTR